MKKAIALLFICSSAYAGINMPGPMPQERTDTPKKANANIGRYLYLGDAPKFEGEEIEMTISKMSLTTRVTAHVNQNRIDNYAKQMLERWGRIDTAFNDERFELHPLVRLQDLNTKKSTNNEAWVKIASQYSSHILEDFGDIYSLKRNASQFTSSSQAQEYSQRISKAYLKFIFDENLEPDAVRSDNQLRDRLTSVENSRKLFEKHFKQLYTKGSSKSGYLGYLTFVYPVAATVAGPFDQPKEQVTDLLTASSIEARWWSDKWNDEFGGFPFLLIEWSGVAFHGPITNYNPLDVWYLRRGYVSHGCHRMDGSDLLEMRAMMPSSLSKTAGKIKVTILNNFDVVDWNKDGVEEVIDVKYYNIPSSINVPKGKTIDQVIIPYLVENQEKSYFKNHAYASKFYDASTDKIKNAPKYNIGAKTLSKSGVHSELPIYRFESRPTRIIQYVEDGIRLQGYDDLSGKYPPKYFQQY
jgi:hypothetical protein